MLPKPHHLIAAFLAAALGSASLVQARIDIVTLPQRDTTELTIYNSQDLTLARESRTLSFAKGSNQIQFSWANTLIDPTSLQIDLANAKGLTVIDAVYPPNTREMIVWNIEAEANTSAPVTIQYFTSGLSWSADYVLTANAEETLLTLQQRITVRNNSGEDFTNAITRVVVGEINLIEMIAELARRGIHGLPVAELQKTFARRSMMGQEMALNEVMAMAPAAFAGRADAAEIIKKAVSEYQLYRIEGEEDILNGWGKQLPVPAVTGIKFDLSYEINPRRFGTEPMRIYKFRNTDDHKLGKEPIPAGIWNVYTNDGRGGSRFEGQTNYKYIPLGEEVELNLGNDGLLQYEERVLQSERDELQFDNFGNVTGWDESRTVELELRNSRSRPVPVKLTHLLDGDWSFQNVSESNFEKVDESAIRWNLNLAGGEKKIIRYTVVVRTGSRARR